VQIVVLLIMRQEVLERVYDTSITSDILVCTVRIDKIVRSPLLCQFLLVQIFIMLNL
jgi:hypothetical protein